MNFILPFELRRHVHEIGLHITDIFIKKVRVIFR